LRREGVVVSSSAFNSSAALACLAVAADVAPSPSLSTTQFQEASALADLRLKG
jgi:hypothetical protein